MRLPSWTGYILPLTYFVWWLNFSNQPTSLYNVVNNPTEYGKMHVVVVGGAGYLGAHTCLQLLLEGHSVSVMDDLAHGGLGMVSQLRRIYGAFSFYAVDMLDQRTITYTLTKLKPTPDVVLYIPSALSAEESVLYPTQYFQNITGRLINLLASMSDVGILKLVFTSSSDIYGEPSQLPVPEGARTTPLTPLGGSSLAAEDIIRALAASNSSFQAVILRTFNVYGWDPSGQLGPPGLEVWSAVERCFEAGAQRAPHVELPAAWRGTKWARDWLHVLDAAYAHAVALQHLSNRVEAYNVGSGTLVTGEQLMEACGSLHAVRPKVVQRTERKPWDGPAQLYADISKISSAMSWRPNHTDLPAGLKDLWQLWPKWT